MRLEWACKDSQKCLFKKLYVRQKINEWTVCWLGPTLQYWWVIQRSRHFQLLFCFCLCLLCQIEWSPNDRRVKQNWLQGNLNLYGLRYYETARKGSTCAQALTRRNMLLKTKTDSDRSILLLYYFHSSLWNSICCDLQVYISLCGYANDCFSVPGMTLETKLYVVLSVLIPWWLV